MNPSNQRMLRMLAMVPFLQSHAGVPVDELAQSFGVKRRQIINDLSVLMMTGVGELHGELIDIDLAALESQGVVHIRDAEFMPRPLRMSVHEASSLIVALRVLRSQAAADQVLAIDTALAKLETAVGRSVDPPVEIAVPDVRPDIREAVLAAIDQKVRLAIDYSNASRDELTRRQVEPRRLFLDKGGLYLWAWCLRADGPRTFRVDRIVSATVTDVPVTDHEDSEDSPEQVPSAASFDTPAVLDLQPEAHWMIEYYNAQVIDDSGLLTRVRVDGSNIEWLGRLVLGGAGAVRAVEPAELVDLVASTLRSTRQLYA